MSVTSPLRTLEPLNRPSVADTVFDELNRQILSLELPPGTKMSEVEVAKALGVSRQPVRDAFYRLSKLGFLSIRPQRATMVSQISETAVLQARFIRNAIEAETVRTACRVLTPQDHAALERLIGQQSLAVDARDPVSFHALDDQFHKEICERAGLGFAWDIIRENKAHMDRVRFLSLSFASQDAFNDHVEVLDAIKARDEERAMQHMRLHLARIKDQIVRIRADHMRYFADETDA
ncbi:MAG: GntR family transcriptional regulator [Hoeflea sp.]|uniref:GntR family transcriptional regulator n=1 Tax=Hoeflea sp. TaxID=1940281 RepID=UPI00272FFF6B|nr:GntR family transcriptional regulator [Hoeflea sp.]MDP2122680.1 GntR family transcriptional regulator [Hoeflea sp.]MDP3526261.1 GntR family transcriptional regulator [Hoeflea sp.]MDZ7603219.1 GntR family transcriptional regulator [Hoeflea sp.]